MRCGIRLRTSRGRGGSSRLSSPSGVTSASGAAGSAGARNETGAAAVAPGTAAVSSPIVTVSVSRAAKKTLGTAKETSGSAEDNLRGVPIHNRSSILKAGSAVVDRRRVGIRNRIRFGT